MKLQRTCIAETFSQQNLFAIYTLTNSGMQVDNCVVGFKNAIPVVNQI